MANEIPNAVALMRDTDFRDWVRAGVCYQAATLIAAGTAPATSLKVANDVVGSPTVHLERFLNVLATRVPICSVGSTVEAIGQTLLLAQIAAVWDKLAVAIYS
jgi:hypothetical protein